jgi:phosphoesterase RecJ-like protein
MDVSSIAVLNTIKKYQKITIFGHEDPDGDCYGSQVGLAEIIKTNFPTIDVRIVGSGLVEFFDVIRPMDEVDDDFIADSLAIMVDVSSFYRVEDQRVTKAKKILIMDHHIKDKQIDVDEYINSNMVACAEVIATFAMTRKLKISKLAATALFLGIVTDSGRFRFPATTAATLSLASYLISLGVDFVKLYEILYQVDETIIATRMYIYTSYKRTKDGVLYLFFDQAKLKELKISSMQASSMVNVLAFSKSSPIWVFFVEEKDHKVRVEFRSSAQLDVQHIARKYGGGGHAEAAGTKLLDGFAQADNILKDLNDLIIESKGRKNEI